jgi:hypothetical protein
MTQIRVEMPVFEGIEVASLINSITSTIRDINRDYIGVSDTIIYFKTTAYIISFKHDNPPLDERELA